MTRQPEEGVFRDEGVEQRKPPCDILGVLSFCFDQSC